MAPDNVSLAVAIEVADANDMPSMGTVAITGPDTI
jgi:hypothetical protein